jgi:hypothetical protein
MSLPNTLKSINVKTPSELKEFLLQYYSSMSPEAYCKHLKHADQSAENRGRENEQVEIICRLLASGMPAEEVATILGIRTNLVQSIERCYAATTIPKYAKKLKERRKRKERRVS